MPLHLLLGVPEAYVADIPGALAAGTAVQAEGGAQPATQGASQQQQQQYSAARAVAPPTTQAAAPVGPSAPASSEPVSQPPQLPAFMLSRLGGSLQQAPAAAPSPPAQLQPQQVKAPAVVKAAGADEDLTELEELLLTGTATGSKQPPAAVQPTPIRPQLTQQPPLPIWAQPAAGTPGRPLPAAASSSKASPAAADELDELLKPHTSGVTQSLVAQLPKGTQVGAVFILHGYKSHLCLCPPSLPAHCRIQLGKLNQNCKPLAHYILLSSLAINAGARQHSRYKEIERSPASWVHPCCPACNIP
jgi:hypothetical protein